MENTTNSQNNNLGLKSELMKFHRDFKLTAECNADPKTFYLTSPSYISPGTMIFVSVMNQSATCNFVVTIKSGCETISLEARPGSTVSYHIKHVDEMLYSCTPAIEDCTENQSCNATVWLDVQYPRYY